MFYMTEHTRIPISKETREALKALKRGGESYDALLKRLIQKAVILARKAHIESLNQAQKVNRAAAS